MKVISVENVSKKFMLAHDRPKNLADAARGLFRRSNREDFWALKDVSFEVEQGEALGIIGHNGAGKSTMLKLLTRIMQPTGGRIRTRGRVSALIEVGAGFHPEMTGRENIYLNGSILGMTRGEIDRKLDEIVAFAELEKFIDTPVKRYSSGMYMRLGFAVAAHTEPDLLLVDEVLAVGDAAFQRKCLDKTRALRSGGTTICLVSHNLGLIRNSCDGAVMLDRGEIRATGNPVSVIDEYARGLAVAERAQPKENRPTEGPCLIQSVVLMDLAGREVATLESGAPMRLVVDLALPKAARPASCGAFLYREDGLYCHGTRSFERDVLFEDADQARATLTYDSLPLSQGDYLLSVGVFSADGVLVYDYHHLRYPLRITNPSTDGGAVTLDCHWGRSADV